MFQNSFGINFQKLLEFSRLGKYLMED